MRSVAFHTLGCKVNQYETQSMVESFKSRGYEIIKDKEVADVYVINTCTVTNIGDRKSRQVIRRMKNRNPNALVVVVGCYAQVKPEEVKALDGVNLVIGTDGRRKIVDYVENHDFNETISIVGNIMEVKDFEEMELTQYEGKTRAFIKVQEGCNQYCTYCIIPYARGKIRSRKSVSIIKEVKGLALKGYKEVVITGIHVASYGKDFYEAGDEWNNPLLSLLKKIDSVDGIERIRLSSLEPNLMEEDFIKELASLEKICPHFHLSLQSGSDEILKRMNRKYTRQKYKKGVDLLRKYFCSPGITTDVIVGFPGETQEQYEETLEFVNQIGFSELHVFKYSPKIGTPAATYRDQVPGHEKQHRSEKLIATGITMQEEYLKSFIGKTEEVLIEDYDEVESAYIGYTPSYVKVRVKGAEDIRNHIVLAKIRKIKEGVLQGDVE